MMQFWISEELFAWFLLSGSVGVNIWGPILSDSRRNLLDVETSGDIKLMGFKFNYEKVGKLENFSKNVKLEFSIPTERSEALEDLCNSLSDENP